MKPEKDLHKLMLMLIMLYLSFSSECIKWQKDSENLYLSFSSECIKQQKDLVN